MNGGSSQSVRFAGRQWLVVALLILAWALAVAGRLLWNGDVYGLDYRLYHPDGKCYSAMAFDYAGQGQPGQRELAETYADQGTPIGELGPDMSDPTVCANGVRPRVFYPLASSPFVSIFGSAGLLVVPALSWLAAILIPVVLLLRRGFLLAPVVSGLLIVASTSVGRWSVANLTDALVMGLMACALLFLPVFGQRSRWWQVAAFCAIIVMGSLTRQSWPIWIAVVLAPWLAYAILHRSEGLRRSMGPNNPWTWFASAGSVAAIAAWRLIDLILGPQNSAFTVNRIVAAVSEPAVSEPAVSEPAVSEPAVWNEIQRALDDALSAIVVEIGQLVVLDKALLIALGLALFGAWKHRRWAMTYSFLGVLFVVLSLSALNTTQGVNFRFALAVVPLVVLLGGTWSTPSGQRQDDSEEKIKEPELLE